MFTRYTLTQLIISLTTLLFFNPVMAYQDCHRASLLNNQVLELPDERAYYPQQKRLLYQALQLCPKHPEAHNNLGNIFEQEPNYPQAIEHYKKAIQARQNYSDAWYGLGEIYYKQGRFPLSFEAHLYACQTDPDSKARVIEFLRTNRYAVTEDGEIIDRESLLVLYDKQRRQNIESMITNCGLKSGPVMQKHIFRNVHFNTGKVSLQLDSERQLEEIAAALRQINPRLIKIHGHTDIQRFKGKSERESDLLNWKLSENRAGSVANALALRGVSKTSMEIKGFGYRQPAQGYSKWDLGKNRRVEIEVE